MVLIPVSNMYPDSNDDHAFPNEKVLNLGLKLAMEWGEDWLKPIQERLRAIDPNLTDTQLDDYNSICQDAMKFGHAKMYALAEKAGSGVDRDAFFRVFKDRYPWASDENMAHCFSQGMYYAWKDGLV